MVIRRRAGDGTYRLPRLLPAVLGAAGVTAVCGCSPQTRYRILTIFFEGVPPPDVAAARADAERAKAELERARKQLQTALEEAGARDDAVRALEEMVQVREAAVTAREKGPKAALAALKAGGGPKASAGGAAAAARTLPAEVPAEEAHSYAEVVKLLPSDAGGNPDWMRALRDGVIRPRHAVDPSAPAMVSLDLNVELTPATNALFTAVFPHNAHTQWLQCPNCHTEIFQMKAGADPITMPKILAGEYCGRCHGKVAFAPGTGCGRCHVKLAAPRPDAVRAELEQARAAPPTAALAQKGRTAYRSYCVLCHGERGDGKGPAAEALVPRPRDFTAGKYKFRTTPGTALPTDADIFRTITVGVPGTSMPAWSGLPADERWGMVQHLKTLNARFAQEKAPASIAIPPPPPPTPEVLDEGKQLFVDAGCSACHGAEGKGDGESAKDLKDDWGMPIRPYNFTGGTPMKSGPAPEDTYRTVMTGLTGTPMPSFGEVLEPKQAWAIVLFARSLSPPAKLPADTAPAPSTPTAGERGKEAGEARREHRRDRHGRGRRFALALSVAIPAVGLAVYGDITMRRASGDLSAAAPAVFPHWFHRIRFRCVVCHPNPFEMRAGANTITMDDIRAGKFCGMCHNGEIAWAPAFDTCARCHAAE